mmetsp:Transcript_30873/g.47264  ORF Transcript_30873/g.47264 Transcript_30873/m.47264 type:complete len:98 (-) Transcript_30873:343-636(-)
MDSYATDFTGFVLWVAELLNNKDHDRVAPGTLQMQGDPTSLKQALDQYDELVSYAGSPGFTSVMFLDFWVLVFCTAFNPSQEYCYDNVIADLSLNSG